LRHIAMRLLAAISQRAIQVVQLAVTQITPPNSTR